MLDEFNKMKASDKPLLVDFYAEWCGPCKMMTPQIEKLKELVGDKANIIKLNIDKPLNRSLVYEYHVQSVPTLILFHKGELRWRQSGVISADNLKEIMEPYM